MKKMFITLIVTTFALTACAGKSTEMPVPQLEISDPGKRIEVTAGNDFKIIIESNPSTGYHWEMTGAFEENVVKYVSNEFRAQEPVAPGSGGSDVWIFHAVAAGETTVTLGLYPPSNDPVEPTQTVTFTIIVK
jgi:inhibitor of cysteine peptidase